MAIPSITILNAGIINLVERDLRKVGRDLASKNRLRKLFEKIRDDVIIPSTDKNFEVGGRPRWEPLAEATVGLSRAAYIASGSTTGTIGGRLPLHKTGKMHKAALAKARFHIRENVMTYGNWPESRWFGPVHNVAAYAQNAQIPHRPFTLFQAEDQVAIGEITMEWIEDAVNRNLRLRYV